MHWLRFSVQSYVKQPLTALFVIFALLTGCAGLSAVLVINAQAKASYAQTAYPMVANVGYLIVANEERSPLTQDDYVALRLAGFYRLVPMLETRLSVTQPEWTESRLLTVIGIDSVAALNWPRIAAGQKSHTDEEDLEGMDYAWQAPYRTLLHRDFARQLGLSSNTELRLESGPSLPALTPIESQGLSQELLMDLGHLQFISGKRHLSQLLVPSLTDVQERTLKQALPAHLTLVPAGDGESAQGLTDTFHLNLLAMGLMMFVVSLFVVMNAFSLVLLQRQDNLRVLRQLGAGKFKLLALLGIEALLLATTCAALGSLLGLWIAAQLSPAVFSTLSGLFDARIRFTELSASTFLPQVMLMSVAGVAAALMMPLRQLSRQLANVKNADAEMSAWWRLTLALMPLALAAALEWGPEHLFRYLTQIAMVLIGGALLLIAVLPKVLAYLHSQVPNRHALWHWASADSLRLSRGSKLAFCAFFLAVAANIGMNLMVDSFRSATNTWLEQRLIADYFIFTESPARLQSTLKTPGQVEAYRLLPRRRADIRVNAAAANQPIDAGLYSYPLSQDYRNAMAFRSRQDNAWQQFEQGGGIFVSEQLQRRLQIKLGDSIEVNQRNWSAVFTLVGIYYDYGNPEGQLLLPEAQVAALDHSIRSFALHTDNIAPLTDIIAASAARLYDSEELMQLSMQAFDNTFAITSALNIITLSVAILSLATSLLPLEQGNRAQWGLMRSLGVPRLKLLATSLSQYGLLTTLTAVVAIPFGLLLSWLLVHKVNAQAFGWSYPLLFNVELIANHAVASALAILACLLLPMWWFARQPLQRHLQWLR